GKNISYNGYGSSKKKKEKNKLTSLKLKSKNKKTNYSYQTNSAPQTYSTYSTNWFFKNEKHNFIYNHVFIDFIV
mgnify:CR=1